MTFDALVGQRRMPIVVTPMLLVSDHENAIAAGRSDILGAFPALNVRSTVEVRQWIERISDVPDGRPSS